MGYLGGKDTALVPPPTEYVVNSTRDPAWEAIQNYTKAADMMLDNGIPGPGAMVIHNPDQRANEERRLASHDPASSAQCHVLIVLILAILALVYFVIRRLRS